MGVSGCGKSTIGAALGEKHGKPFLDGDDFHPAENVEKMRSGKPLNDSDRWPWLKILGKATHETANEHGQVFVACSALKQSYRDALCESASEPVLFIHLDGSQNLIAARMAERSNHYMPAGLLDSQIATLEPPESGEFSIQINIDQSCQAIVQKCEEFIALR